MKNHDITRVPNNGKIIFPLSMSRLGNAQSPQALYDFLVFFETKIQQISLDVILLYTNDLYLNTDDLALEVRKKSLNQMKSHKNELTSLVAKKKKYVPQSFHYLPWDYVVINSQDFEASMNGLSKLVEDDEGFAQAITADVVTQGREMTKTNQRFILEETAVTHLLLQDKSLITEHTVQ